MTPFVGRYENRVDSKGRVSVPAPFRAICQAQGGESVYLYDSLTNAPCVEGCGQTFMDDWNRALAGRPVSDPVYKLITKRLFRGQPCLPDDTGRIVLPARFMDRAGVADRAVFVGVGRYFQIWSPEALAADEAEDEASLAAAMDGLTMPEPLS